MNELIGYTNFLTLLVIYQHALLRAAEEAIQKNDEKIALLDKGFRDIMDELKKTANL